jgi:hypothetical protein
MRASVEREREGERIEMWERSERRSGRKKMI